MARAFFLCRWLFGALPFYPSTNQMEFEKGLYRQSIHNSKGSADLNTWKFYLKMKQLINRTTTATTKKRQNTFRVNSEAAVIFHGFSAVSAWLLPSFDMFIAIPKCSWNLLIQYEWIYFFFGTIWRIFMWPVPLFLLFRHTVYCWLV